MNKLTFASAGLSSCKDRIFMFYPPGALYQRGEDRCQGNVSDSTATAMRAPNDMGYLSAILKQKGHDVFFRDYQTERLSLDILKVDFVDFSPSIIVLSVTNTTIKEDVEIATELKALKKDISIILKGALFFDPNDELFNVIDLSGIDYLVGGESEFAISEIVDCSREKNMDALSKINGILFRGKDGNWVKTNFSIWETDLDLLPYPDRGIINNRLYLRPDTGRPQATIVTSRGCPASCVYCLTPTISGRKVRYRTPENILGELRECYHKFGISDFFFRSDTFTINSEWVRDLCGAITASELSGKIQWVANSRVKPLAEDTLKIMKDAGCWLVAFGFESGSDESLILMKKGASVQDNLRAARLAKKAGLEIFGFYMMGLPWENWKNLEETKQHIYEIDADYVEIHIAIPYFGTKLYDIAKEYHLINETVIGKDYFNAPTIGTKYIPIKQILEYRKTLLLEYHFRWRFLRKKILKAVSNPIVLKNYIIFALRLIKNNVYRKV